MGNKNGVHQTQKVLHKDGYIRIAPEVYMRIVQNRKASEKHYRIIEEVAPKTGVARLLSLMEKQYNNIYMVSGNELSGKNGSCELSYYAIMAKT